MFLKYGGKATKDYFSSKMSNSEFISSAAGELFKKFVNIGAVSDWLSRCHECICEDKFYSAKFDSSGMFVQCS